MYETNQTRHGICPIFSILIKKIYVEKDGRKKTRKRWKNEEQLRKVE